MPIDVYSTYEYSVQINTTEERYPSFSDVQNSLAPLIDVGCVSASGESGGYRVIIQTFESMQPSVDAIRNKLALEGSEGGDYEVVVEQIYPSKTVKLREPEAQ